MKKKREDWFESFKKDTTFDHQTILDFHKNAGIGNKDVDLQIDRGFLKTRSITQIVKKEEALSMRYENLQNNEVNTVVFEAVTAI